MAPIVDAIQTMPNFKLHLTLVNLIHIANQPIIVQIYDKHPAMLLYFLYPLAEDYQFFNLFRYLTFRTGGAMITALIISFIFGPFIIQWLRHKQKGASNIREDVPFNIWPNRGHQAWVAF